MQKAGIGIVFQGVYSSGRAAALAGVPLSTLQYWARHHIWRPSISTDRPRRWSYADLLALRTIYWLRHVDGKGTRHASMPEIRTALTSLRRHKVELWHPNLRIFLDGQGRIHLNYEEGVWRPGRYSDQGVLPGSLDLLAAFRSSAGVGPDLRRPRPHLRIIPGKLSGEPHVEDTRITTRSLAALVRDGLQLKQVQGLYPDLGGAIIKECLELEKQLGSTRAA